MPGLPPAPPDKLVGTSTDIKKKIPEKKRIAGTATGITRLVLNRETSGVGAISTIALAGTETDRMVVRTATNWKDLWISRTTLRARMITVIIAAGAEADVMKSTRI